MQATVASNLGAPELTARRLYSTHAVFRYALLFKPKHGEYVGRYQHIYFNRGDELGYPWVGVK